MPAKRARARSEKKQPPEMISIRAVWQESDELPIIFANHFWLRLQDDQFLLTFGQSEPPRQSEFSDKEAAKLEQHGIPIRTVCRLAMPAPKVEQTIKALNSVYDTWLTTRKSEESGDATK